MADINKENIAADKQRHSDLENVKEKVTSTSSAVEALQAEISTFKQSYESSKLRSSEYMAEIDSQKKGHETFFFQPVVY